MSRSKTKVVPVRFHGAEATDNIPAYVVLAFLKRQLFRRERCSIQNLLLKESYMNVVRALFERNHMESQTVLNDSDDSRAAVHGILNQVLAVDRAITRGQLADKKMLSVCVAVYHALSNNLGVFGVAEQLKGLQDFSEEKILALAASMHEMREVAAKRFDDLSEPESDDSRLNQGFAVDDSDGSMLGGQASPSSGAPDVEVRKTLPFRPRRCASELDRALNSAKRTQCSGARAALFSAAPSAPAGPTNEPDAACSRPSATRS
ncbi:MAG: hypothetical protein COV52_05705 [Gammaproteobacteria bacterium CG11_big_fil_rev_8_21_14_0_20_46_22]|nr:MAG: hypothetical protein COW05_07955 [Gammaproteobacteria bacterium CG12_big_fil_rev_8_21_14_0_65_46_12]PIR11000.1 MAG: hypothetical protein COV52_05705 [Gammaproteobacteria bacterium CG11_big_fil_rev_8_21_14_0_20_46_22]